MNSIEIPEIQPHNYAQQIFDRILKQLNGRERAFSTNDARKAKNPEL